MPDQARFYGQVATGCQKFAACFFVFITAGQRSADRSFMTRTRVCFLADLSDFSNPPGMLSLY
ncbi:hypothetical protein C3E80_21900 [Cronobacter malonaticus]|uniref:Uncharacterized protein n=1 Tax=Cronobacter malonaticus TaxID=413503 RepID=A0A423XPS8_9ENTR|nr:hypothetical protein C3E80_21900 [Cronobacter malonaticus]